MTVTGGKLTTYREMAADTVDAVVEQLDGAAVDPPGAAAPSSSLLGGAGGAPPRPSTDAHLADRYGGEARRARALARRPTRRSAEPLVAGLPYLRAEAVYAVRHEMARTVDDVLSRRTRARLLARDASAAAAAAVGRADRRRARLGRRREPRARSRPTVALDRRRARRPGLPETDLVPRSTR